jgi:hypothetical protein
VFSYNHFSLPFLLLLLILVHVVILFLSFSLTGIALLSSATVRSSLTVKKKKRRIPLRLSLATAVVAVKCNGKQVVTCTFLQSSSSFSLIDIKQKKLFFDIYIYLLETNTSFNIKSNTKYTRTEQ